MEKVLSIIIPTYNMENYLHNCLDSVIVDNPNLLQALEVLVINDGSKDKSSEIAHSYEKRYPHVFRVIDKKNGNYGSCVNAGLPLSTGKYVKILDADDYVCKEQFQKYLAKLQTAESDMIINEKCTVDLDGNILAEWKVGLAPDTVLGFSDVSKCVQALDLHKIAYKRSLLFDMDYHQTEGVSYTDTEWALFPFSRIETATYLPYSVYCYRQGREGQTVERSVRSKALKSLRITQFSLGDYMQNFQGSQERKQFIFNMFVFDLLLVYEEFLFHNYYDKDEFRKLDSELMSRYPEIQSSIDNHPWVSFLPELQLVRDWREKKTVKYALEMGLIRVYLLLARLKNSSKTK